MDKGLQYKYEKGFIKERKEISLNKVDYRKKAIVNALKKYCDLNKNKSVLDVGFGSTNGIITQEIAKNALKVVGIEIDEPEVKIANKLNEQSNCFFYKGDGRYMQQFENESFDIVLCTRVIEHIPEKIELLFKEITRVLKKDGLAYIAVDNKFIPFEPHYRLLFLSWLPKKLADAYVKITRKGKSYEIKYLTYNQLNKYFKENKLKPKDITIDLIKNSKKLGYKSNKIIVNTAKILDLFPESFKSFFSFISPVWIIVLKKD
ncbi:MAG: class I SAM-dependent methyltransferase [Nanoarchaeota archaeon]|nr:class I SAM-dependent methyltransferase [Nanoarchaeota archaeon]